MEEIVMIVGKCCLPDQNQLPGQCESPKRPTNRNNHKLQGSRILMGFVVWSVHGPAAKGCGGSGDRNEGCIIVELAAATIHLETRLAL